MDKSSKRCKIAALDVVTRNVYGSCSRSHGCYIKLRHIKIKKIKHIQMQEINELTYSFNILLFQGFMIVIQLKVSQ